MSAGSAFAKAGLERLSTEAFQHDLAPFINEAGTAHELTCALIVWEEGLQAWVEADLRAQAEATPTNVKTYFSLLAWDLYKTMIAPTSKNRKNKETPAKPISRTATINGIKLYEQWDLDK